MLYNRDQLVVCTLWHNIRQMHSGVNACTAEVGVLSVLATWPCGCCAIQHLTIRHCTTVQEDEGSWLLITTMLVLCSHVLW